MINRCLSRGLSIILKPAMKTCRINAGYLIPKKCCSRAITSVVKLNYRSVHLQRVQEFISSMPQYFLQAPLKVNKFPSKRANQIKKPSQFKFNLTGFDVSIGTAVIKPIIKWYIFYALVGSALVIWPSN